jgi:opacity protein-like surface antigen
MNRIAVILLLAVMVPSIASAQEKVTMGLNLHVVSPQGPFAQNVDRLGFGGQFTGAYRFDRTPISIGAELSFHNYGIDSRVEALSSTIPDLRVEVQNSYNQLALMLSARAEPYTSGSVRPYLEALWGTNYFFTETSIHNRFSSGEEPIASDTNIDDWAMAWGGGAGVQIKIHETESQVFGGFDEEMKTVPTNVFLNLGVRYLYGNEATYLKEGSVRVSNGTVTYDTSRSKTDMMVFQVGVTVKF